MIKFTKEQLITRAKENIARLKTVALTVSGHDAVVVAMQIEVDEIALAALTAEPVAYISDSNLRALERGVGSVYVKNKPVLVRPSTLYRLPLLEGLK